MLPSELAVMGDGSARDFLVFDRGLRHSASALIVPGKDEAIWNLTMSRMRKVMGYQTVSQGS